MSHQLDIKMHQLFLTFAISTRPTFKTGFICIPILVDLLYSGFNSQYAVAENWKKIVGQVEMNYNGYMRTDNERLITM